MLTAVELLRALVRIDSTNPPGNEEQAAQLLETYLGESGLKTHMFKSPEGRVSLVGRMEGPTDRPALVLLSHTDVVSVERDAWTHDPFGGEIDSGCIWGRGTLDMKGIAAMHAHSVADFASSGATPSREVIVVAVADEEAGGSQGAGWLLSEHSTELGFGGTRPAPEVLGEGAFGLAEVIDRPLMPIALGEKSAAWIRLRATGTPGHGALPPQSQAPLNLAAAIADVAGFGTPRVHPVVREQMRILAEHSSGARAAVFRALASPAGAITARAAGRALRASSTAVAAMLADTITPTQIEAGYKHNVVPGDATAALDCRLLPDTDIDAFTADLSKRASRHDTSVDLVARHSGPVSSRGPLYSMLAEASARAVEGAVVVPTITPGMTDLRMFRARGATGYGWVPLVLTPELLGTIHGHDERVPLDTFETAVAATDEVVRRAVV